MFKGAAKRGGGEAVAVGGSTAHTERAAVDTWGSSGLPFVPCLVVPKGATKEIGVTHVLREIYKVKLHLANLHDASLQSQKSLPDRTPGICTASSRALSLLLPARLTQPKQGQATA